MKKKLMWAVLFSTGFMFLLFRHIEWKYFTSIAENLKVSYLITAYVFFIIANFVRTLRFYRMDHVGKKLTHWWIVNNFYNMITATLPGGTGEVATAYILKRFSMLNILGAFRILILSRLMDLAALSVLFLFAAIRMSKITPYREAAIILSMALCLTSFLALIPACEQYILKLLQKNLGKSRLAQKIGEKLDELYLVSKEQCSVHAFSMTLGQSFLIMIITAIYVHVLFQAFGIEFSVIQSFYCYGIYAIFQIIPIQGVAGIGTQAAWWALALGVAGYDDPDKIALGLVLHGTYYLFIAFLSGVSVLIWLAQRNR